MAKQKGGLGKGIDVLFNSSEVPVENSAKQEAPKAEKPAKEAPKQEKKPETREVQDIRFSDDALENAKVVERAPRKAQAAAKSEKEKKTAAPAAKPAETKKPVKTTLDEGDVVELPIEQVVPNQDQPRRTFKKEEIDELAASIKRDGLLNPITVTKMGDTYQIIAGERRWRACKAAGMKKIAASVRTVDSEKALELALVENIQRADLSPIEEAYGYKSLMEHKGMTQSEVAQVVSKGRSTIANALRLLELPEEAQQLLHEGKITAGHARAILSIPDAEGRKKLTDKLVAEKLSVREAEAIARLFSGKVDADKREASKRVPLPASFKRAAQSLRRTLSAPVRVKNVRGKSKIEITFEDEKDLERILSIISPE